MHHTSLTFYQTLEFDMPSNYHGKTSAQWFIGVSNHMHLTKLADPDWLVNSWIGNEFEKELSKTWNCVTIYSITVFNFLLLFLRRKSSEAEKNNRSCGYWRPSGISHHTCWRKGTFIKGCCFDPVTNSTCNFQVFWYLHVFMPVSLRKGGGGDGCEGLSCMNVDQCLKRRY